MPLLLNVILPDSHILLWYNLCFIYIYSGYMICNHTPLNPVYDRYQMHRQFFFYLKSHNTLVDNCILEG